MKVNEEREKFRQDVDILTYQNKNHLQVKEDLE